MIDCDRRAYPLLLSLRYFARFDSSRATLEYLYTQDAIFSVKVLTRIPARVRQSMTPTPFPKRFTSSQGKVSATPTSIVNAITHLPTGSHDLSKIIYDARELPELRARPGKAAPILLHLQAEFDEFPQHIVRSVYRTFFLVPKNSSTGGAGCPLKYQVKSDQLVYGHYDPTAPARLHLLPSLDPTPPPPPPPVLQQVAPTPRRPSPPPPAPIPPAQALPRPTHIVSRLTPLTPAPAPTPTARRHPPSATTTSNARSAEKRLRPIERSPPPPPAPRPMDDDDIIILSDSDDEEEDQAATRPTKRVNRHPSLEIPTAAGQPCANALGKRRAVSPPSLRHRAVQQTGASSSMARQLSNQSASSRVDSSSSGDGSDSSDDVSVSDPRSAVQSITRAGAEDGLTVHMSPAQLAEFVDQRLKEAREKERREEKQEEERKRKEKEKEVKRKEQKRKEKERLAKEKKLAALQATERHAVPTPFAPLSDDGDAPSGAGGGGASTSAPQDARIVIPGGSHSVLHGEPFSRCFRFLFPVLTPPLFCCIRILRLDQQDALHGRRGRFPPRHLALR